MAIGPDQALPAMFPLADIEAALDDWWEAEQVDAALPGDPAPSRDIMSPTVEKFEIPESVIKKGGYDDFAEMRGDLIPRLQALYDKKREKQNA